MCDEGWGRRQSEERGSVSGMNVVGEYLIFMLSVLLCVSTRQRTCCVCVCVLRIYVSTFAHKRVFLYTSLCVCECAA
jgi:hypothetical protein